LIDKKIKKMHDEVNALNKKFKLEYEKYRNQISFTKFIMSEAMTPIEDYPNIVNLIRTNEEKVVCVDILLIGTYLAIIWTENYDEMLNMMNLRYNTFSNREKAIAHYLKSYKMLFLEEDYLSNPSYMNELYSALNYDNTFVNCHRRIAESGKIAIDEAHKHYIAALHNIEKVLSFETVKHNTLKYRLNPKQFIKKYIWGSIVSEDDYQNLLSVIGTEKNESGQ